MSNFDETFDFVVVGSGGGSMCAALVARQAGKSVAILEKTDLVGGSTAKAGGVMWIPNNIFMQKAGIPDSNAEATAYLDATVGVHSDSPGATPERRAAYIRESNRMIAFLVDQGIKLGRVPYWPDYYDERAGGNEAGRTVVADLFNVNELGSWADRLRANHIEVAATLSDLFEIQIYKRSWRGKLLMLKTGFRIAAARLTGKRWVTAGAALQGRMLQAALRREVEIRLTCGVRRLILEGDRVTGVVTHKDGREWRIGATCGVLLNAGGFAHNQAMRDKYIPHTSTDWTHAAPGDTGDMHQELARLGAWMAQMDEMVGNQMTLPPDSGPQGVQMQLAKPHAFLVDQSGVRYMNEGGSYMQFCQDMLKRHKDVPAIPSWMIMDSRFLKDYMLAQTMPGTNKPAAWFDRNYIRTGQTVEELAGACGLDPARLKATTERFNRFAVAGLDEDFGRGKRKYDRFLGDHTHEPNATLGTVAQGPFYAVPVVPGDVGTFGGVVTDCDARVLREDGSIIGGLYATGTTTASVMGRAYPGAGCSIGPSFTWGFVAAVHAMRGNER